jgi:hypothetical protein
LEVVVVALSCTVSEDVHWLWLLHFEQDDLEDDSSGEGFEQRASGQGLAAMTRLFDPRMRVLLLHTGGDSKRVPWANSIGKAFIPLPFLAGDDPDGAILTLFDHILAVSASVLQSFPNNGELSSKLLVWYLKGECCTESHFGGLCNFWQAVCLS